MTRIRLQAFPAQYTPIPFEYFSFLARQKELKAEKELAIDTELGKTKGAFAALQAAPGHEALREALVKDFDSRVNNLYDKYKNNLTSREMARELTSLKTEFVNNPSVQKVSKSWDWYSKNQATLWDVQSKSGFVDAPGILNNKGQFEPNEIEYNYSAFKITPYGGDVLTRMQQTITLSKEQKIKESGIEQATDADGNLLFDLNNRPVYRKEDVETVFKNPETLNATLDSIYDTIVTNAEIVPEYKWLVRDLKGRYGEKGWKGALANIINEQAAPPNYFEWRDKKVSYLDEDGKQTTGRTKKEETSNKGPKNLSPEGKEVTVSVDPVMNELNQPVYSADDFEKYYQNTRDRINTLRGEALNLFFKDANGNSTLVNEDGTPKKYKNGRDVTGFVQTEYGPQIDVNYISDPNLKSQALAKNNELRYSYLKMQELQFARAHFARNNNFDADMPLENMVNPDVKKAAYSYTGITMDKQVIHSQLLETLKTAASNNQKIDPQVLELVNTLQTPVYEKGRFLDIHSPNYEETVTRNLQVLDGIANHKNAPQSTKLAAVEMRKQFDGILQREFKKDIKYRNYSQDLEKWLQSTVYKQEFRYALVKDEDVKTAKNLAELGRGDGSFERAKVDTEKPLFGSSKNIKEKTALQANDYFWDNASYHIRYDSSRSEWVVDVVGATEKDSADPLKFEAIEIRNVTGVSELANKIDPIMSVQYLTEQQQFFDQLNATNGRMAILSSYKSVKDAAGNVTKVEDLGIKVKTVLETVESGEDVTPSDYIFKLPELNSTANGPLVMKASSYYDLNKFIFEYNDIKSNTVYTEEEKAERLDTLIQNANKYNIVAFNGDIGGLNSEYFPIENSAYNKRNNVVSTTTPRGTTTSTIQTPSYTNMLGPEYAKLSGILNRVEASSYDTLFNNAEIKSGPFQGMTVTDKTLGELYEFTSTGGDYDIYTKNTRDPDDPKSQPKATPLGKYQIVGATLRAVAKALNLSDDTKFTPEIQDKMFLYLLNQRLKRGRTTAEKRAQLRAEWEGLIKVKDSELDEAIKELEKK